MKKKISGIYKIENLINHKVYIGQSKDIKSILYKSIQNHTNFINILYEILLEK